MVVILYLVFCDFVWCVCIYVCVHTWNAGVQHYMLKREARNADKQAGSSEEGRMQRPITDTGDIGTN